MSYVAGKMGENLASGLALWQLPKVVVNRMGLNLLVWCWVSCTWILCISSFRNIKSCEIVLHMRSGMGKRSGFITWSRLNGTNSVTINQRVHKDFSLAQVFRVPKKGFANPSWFDRTTKPSHRVSCVCWIWYRVLFNWGSKISFEDYMINVTESV